MLSKGPLHKLLTNPVYCGLVRYEAKIYQGTHEPIVSKALYDAVQERLHGRSSPFTRRVFPYRGLMTCGYCGCVITASLIKGNHVYYHCTRGREKCTQDFVPQDEVSALFIPTVEGVKLSKSFVRQLLEGIEREGERRKREGETRLRALRLEMKTLAEMGDRAYEDKLKGSISEERWVEMERRWAEREGQLRRQMEAVELAEGPAEDEAEATFKLLERAPELYQRQSHDERARPLRALVSNSILAGGKLEPIYKQPFDLVAEGVSRSLWLPRTWWDDLGTSARPKAEEVRNALAAAEGL